LSYQTPSVLKARQKRALGALFVQGGAMAKYEEVDLASGALKVVKNPIALDRP